MAEAPKSPSPRRSTVPDALVAAGAAALVVVYLGTLSRAVRHGELPGASAALLALFGCLCLWFGLAFRRAMRDGSWPSVESHWGGPGGGGGGWRISPSLAYLLGLLVTGSLAVAVAMQGSATGGP